MSGTKFGGLTVYPIFIEPIQTIDKNI